MKFKEEEKNRLIKLISLTTLLLKIEVESSNPDPGLSITTKVDMIYVMKEMSTKRNNSRLLRET